MAASVLALVWEGRLVGREGRRVEVGARRLV